MITFFPEARKVSESQDFSKWRIGDETHFKYQTLLNASFTIVLNFFHFIGTKSLYLVKPQQTNYFVSISATQRPDWSRTDQSEARVGSSPTVCNSSWGRPPHYTAGLGETETVLGCWPGEGAGAVAGGCSHLFWHNTQHAHTANTNTTSLTIDLIVNAPAFSSDIQLQFSAWFSFSFLMYFPWIRL